MRSTFVQIIEYFLRIECEWNKNDIHKYLSIGRDAIVFGYPVHLLDQVPRNNSGMSIKECSFSLDHLEIYRVSELLEDRRKRTKKTKLRRTAPEK